MTCIDVSMKRHDLVTICDVTEHNLPSNSAKEGLINYSIFKTLYFPVLQVHALSLSLRLPRVLKHYITLQYITMVFCNLHCI